jgi:DNA-binding NtrC family response regulator
MGRHVTLVPREVMDALQHHNWPGNLRELQNVVERALIRSTGDVLEVDEVFAVQRPPAENDETRVTVDGVDQHDNTIPLVDDHQEHYVEVSIPMVRS